MPEQEQNHSLPNLPNKSEREYVMMLNGSDLSKYDDSPSPYETMRGAQEELDFSPEELSVSSDKVD